MLQVPPATPPATPLDLCDPRCSTSRLRLAPLTVRPEQAIAPGDASPAARLILNGFVGCCDTTHVVPPAATVLLCTAASPNFLTRVGVVRSPTPTFSRDLHSPHQDAFHVRPTAALSSSSVALPDATAGCSSGWLLGETHQFRRTCDALSQRRPTSPGLAHPNRPEITMAA